MNQQINLYVAEFRPETNAFRSKFMLQAVAIFAIGLMLAYVIVHRGLDGVDEELRIVAAQEAAALDRLQNIRPLITAITGERSWSDQLDDATRALAERQSLLSLMQGNSLGDTRGFSRHLRALARQHIDGLWLTRVVLSPEGDSTRIEGHAIRAELVPLYVQELTAEPAFATQRFHRFQIDNPTDDAQTAMAFSMESQVLRARNFESVQ